MMKRLSVLMVAILLALCCAPAFAAEGPQMDESMMANDAAYFATFVQAAGWQMPAGYSLEVYIRADINEDRQEELMASLLAGDGVARMLFIGVSDASGYKVHTSDRALPATNAGALGNDPFLGFSAGAGYLNIHTGGEDVASYENTYAFGLEAGALYLDDVYVSQWNASTEVATENVFNLVDGLFESLHGHMHGHVFHADGTMESHQFDPAKAVFTLEDFDIDAFPLDWEGFAAMLAQREGPHPTHTRAPRPTSRPTARPTRWPNPSEMPGPVYPSEMPGPVYPSEMPGPVYPSEMPGPVYPTPSPEPTWTPGPIESEMPGPIPWDEGGDVDGD